MVHATSHQTCLVPHLEFQFQRPAGRFAAALAHGHQPEPAPRLSANGSLTRYITHAESKRFQPANITFDLLPPLEEELRLRIRDKKERHRLQCEQALAAWDGWLSLGVAADAN